MIAWIWLISFMSALPWAFYTKVNYLLYDGKIVEESAWCSIPFTEETSGSLYIMLASTLLYFFAPLVVVSFIYSRHIATTFSLIYLLFLLLRIGLALHRDRMKRCAATGGVGGEGGQAERSDTW